MRISISTDFRSIEQKEEKAEIIEEMKNREQERMRDREKTDTIPLRFTLSFQTFGPTSLFSGASQYFI